MECTNEATPDKCGCSNKSCERRGNCCKCVAHRKSRGELPGCFFPPDAEKTQDRSVAYFIKCMGEK